MGSYYQSTSDPRKIASNQRSNIYYQGQALTADQQRQAEQFASQRQGTADYLNEIEDPLAQGNGGYNADEASQIRMTPAQQQDIVNKAGISAGASTAAAVGAADRATAAAGGNPAAVAAYRLRAAQQSGAAAGDAETNARVAASDAAAGREENIGQTRLAQQAQGLNYYQGQNQQANQNQQNEQALQNQTYNTQTNGTNQAAGIGLNASQTPSTFDKILGGVSGALSFLEDGGDTKTAVVAEGGQPEKVVNARYLEDGDALEGGDGVADASTPTPWAATPTPWYKALMSKLQQPRTQVSQPQQSQWNPVTPYQQLGSSIAEFGTKAASGLANGKGAASFLQDGGHFEQGDGGLFTEPTKVKLGKDEAVVPLHYRPGAKLRPNVAQLPAALNKHHYYGAAPGMAHHPKGFHSGRP